ncbi:MAG: L,D-transpeptidase [Alphaproteobacteria bacterium]|nr:L,D-transpeptidase [Alphaproteobacteria bacterium]
MQRHVFTALVMSAIGIVSAKADPMSLLPDRYPQSTPRLYAQPQAAPQVQPAPAARREPGVQYAAAQSEVNLGGGFIEFLFSGARQGPPRPPSEVSTRGEPAEQQMAMAADPRLSPNDPKFQKQVVEYRGSEPAGTVIVDTPNRFLFLVQGNGTALRYGIGVGKPGFTWAGEKKITAKKEWPDWTPPPEMLERRPDLPHFMAGGPENPLGARAMYLGSSLYRIHGSNEPWTIGQAVSSGCIRMRNEDVIDLFEKVKVGTKVMVI